MRMCFSESQPTLWNHTMDGAYPRRDLKDIPGVWRYGARALSCTNPGDKIQLDPQLRGEYGWIQEHYDNVGLETADEVIFNSEIELIKDYPDYEWEVFLFSELHHEARPNERWRDATRDFNCKNYFISLCMERGWRVPYTQCFGSKRELLYPETPDIRFPVYLKVACSAAGIGVTLCKDISALQRALDAIGDDIPFQFQTPVYRPKAFLNLQYFVNEKGKSERLGLSEQVLDGFSHAGNVYPCGYERSERVFELCDPVAAVVAERGMRGVFAFDVAISGEGTPYLIECNPRWNACTYYWKVAEELGVGHWLSRNLSVGPRTLRDFDLDEMEFDNETGRGVVIISWGTVHDGKLGVLFAGESRAECDQLATKFKERFGVTKGRVKSTPPR